MTQAPIVFARVWVHFANNDLLRFCSSELFQKQKPVSTAAALLICCLNVFLMPSLGTPTFFTDIISTSQRVIMKHRAINMKL